MLDLLIKNGTIVDGTDAPAMAADVGIMGGKIVKIAPHITDDATKTIDAEGKIVSPGFIDYHSHSDNTLLEGPTGYNYLEQGVTTQIGGQCGTHPAPFYEGGMEEEKKQLSPEDYAEYTKKCSTFKSFTQAVEQTKFGVNMAFYAGHGSLRGAVMGYKPGIPNKPQMEKMRQLMREAMEAGYIGFTTGLVYAPSVYAGEEELVELAKVVHEFGGSYASHIRGEADNVVESVNEAIRIGERAKIPVIISHVKVIGTQNEGKSEEIIAAMEHANARGVKVRADQYPYLGGSAPFISGIPPQFHTDGEAALVENLKKPAFRASVKGAMISERERFASNIIEAGFGGTLLVGCLKTEKYVGKTIAEIAKKEKKDPFDVCFDLLVENDGVAQAVYFSQNQSDMMRLIEHPYVMGGSDWSNYPKMFDEDKVGGGHPRGSSTFVQRLALIRDNKLRTLENSVYSITGLPAEMAGIPSIGVLKEGARADVCVFDYEKLGTTSDYIHPFRKNTGIDFVVVGGKLAVENGKYNGEMNGKLLKRGE